MKNVRLIICSVLIIANSGCKKYLDINDNPNGPTSADPALYLPSIQSQYATGIQLDSRLIGPYIQNFLHSTSGIAYDLHGYVRSSDFGGEFWRSVYWKGGLNTIDMINNATAQKKWDIVGTGMALQAFGWQNLTDYHGPVILKQAFDPTKNTFDYDPQDTVYAYVKRLCMDAITELGKNDDATGSPLFSRYDMIYKGDRAKWIKFTYGVLAINAHHLIKKPFYKPDEVISYVDKALSSNADDAIVPFSGTNATDASALGPRRQNFGVYGQSSFIVRLTDGSIFGIIDPRQPLMLTPSTDGVYRGLTPGSGQSSTVSNAAHGVRSVWGSPLGVNVPTGGPWGKYLFQDAAGFPLMSYAELQFIKAEAAFFKGDKALALTAYRNGVNASLDFVRSVPLANASFAANYTAERTAFLANPLVIPVTPAALTINQILLQKYIALWGWGFIEIWTDLRKYDYDGNIFTSFTIPASLFPDNNNKPAYRVRPRYNSEYVWNIDALTAIGGFDADYATKKLWIHLP